MALVFVAARGLSPAVASGATLQLRFMAFLVVDPRLYGTRFGSCGART